MAKNFKRILRSSSRAMLRTVYTNLGLTRQDLRDDVNTLAQTLQFRKEDASSVPFQGRDPTTALLKFTSKFPNYGELRAVVRQVVEHKTGRICPCRVKEQMPKVANILLFGPFHFGFELAKNEIKTTFFDFLKCLSKKIAQNDALYELFVCNIAQWP